MPWNATEDVRNAGPDAGITSLRVQRRSCTARRYHFGPGGNLEGTFRRRSAPATSSGPPTATATRTRASRVQRRRLRRSVTRTTAATSAAASRSTAVGLPARARVDGRSRRRNLHDVTATRTGTAEAEPVDGQLAAGDGLGHRSRASARRLERDRQRRLRRPRRRVPDASTASTSRASSASAARSLPTCSNPSRARGSWQRIVPTLVPTSPTSVRVSWMPASTATTAPSPTRSFRDRPGAGALQTTADSNWWTLPALGFVDTGLTPGATYEYQIIVSDPAGTTSSATRPESPCRRRATQHRTPTGSGGRRAIYWPLNEAAGYRAAAAVGRRDRRAGVTDGRADIGVTCQPGRSMATPARASTTANDRAGSSPAAPRSRRTCSPPRRGSRRTRRRAGASSASATCRPAHRPPRSPHLHDQRRPAGLRGLGQDNSVRTLSARKRTTTTSGTRSRPRWGRAGCGSTSTASASPTAPTPPRASSTSATGGRWRQPRQLAERRRRT